MIVPIIVCEVGFWVVLVLGLSARYLLRQRLLGVILLLCVPLIDLILLAIIVLDLRGGATAHWSHGLGAIYLAVSVVYGHRMVTWADRWFAYRFDGAPRPQKVRRYGRARAAHEWKETGILLLAVGIGAAVLLGCVALFDDPARTQALSAWFGRLGVVSVAAVIWAVTYTVFPAKAPAEATRASN
jgi:hypothetical protein